MKTAGHALGEHILGQLAGAELLAKLEGVKVGDHHPRLAQLFKLMTGNDVAQTVIVVGVVGKQDAQTIADRDAGADDQKGVAEAGILRDSPAC